MFGIIAVLVAASILAGTSYYLAHRLYQGFASFLSGMQFWPMLVILATLILLLVLGFLRALLPFPTDVKRILGLTSGYCMGVLLYLLLFTIATDLFLIVPRLIKLPFANHHLLNGFITLIVLLLTGITCIYGFINARQINHTTYEIQLQDKKDISDLTVVMISDLHLGAIGSESRLETIVKEINALTPDIVCISGDFFDTDIASIQNPEAALKTLQPLQPVYGTYACLGNHDGGHTHDQMVEFLGQANIQLLSDTYTMIDNRLVLVGRLDASPIGGYGGQKRKELSAFFIRNDPDLPVIVLDHNPAHIGEYSTEADLILCGHTHKGQVFPGNLITSRMYTVDYGYYQKDAQSPHVIVTSGIGTWGMPMRVGTHNEIVTLRFALAK